MTPLAKAQKNKSATPRWSLTQLKKIAWALGGMSCAAGALVWAIGGHRGYGGPLFAQACALCAYAVELAAVGVWARGARALSRPLDDELAGWPEGELIVGAVRRAWERWVNASAALIAGLAGGVGAFGVFGLLLVPFAIVAGIAGVALFFAGSVIMWLFGVELLILALKSEQGIAERCAQAIAQTVAPLCAALACAALLSYFAPGALASAHQFAINLTGQALADYAELKQIAALVLEGVVLALVLWAMISGSLAG